MDAADGVEPDEQAVVELYGTLLGLKQNNNIILKDANEKVELIRDMYSYDNFHFFAEIDDGQYIWRLVYDSTMDASNSPYIAKIVDKL